MIPIEILGTFTKAFALCVRLFANMTAGHIVIVSLLGLIFVFGKLSPALGYTVSVPSVLFTLGIDLLELFVAFLQAYIFTMLTSLFMGLGMQVESITLMKNMRTKILEIIVHYLCHLYL